MTTDQGPLAQLPDETPAPPVLDYAAAPPWYGRRRVRRLLALVVLLVIAIPLIQWGPLAWYYAKLQYRLHQCLKYVAPPTQVVYEVDPARTAELLKSGGGYIADPGSAGSVALFVPECFAELDRLTPPFQPPRPIIFLHERLAKRSGLRRLVVVQHTVLPVPGLNGDGGLLIGAAIDPGSLVRLPQHADYITLNPLRQPQRSLLPSLGMPSDLRIYAGHADPSDSSHFSFTCRMNRQDYTVDGWLQEDGRHVTFQVTDAEGRKRALDPIEARLKNGNVDPSSISGIFQIDALLPGLRSGTQPSGRITGEAKVDGGVIGGRFKITGDELNGDLQIAGLTVSTTGPAASLSGNLNVSITSMKLATTQPTRFGATHVSLSPVVGATTQPVLVPRSLPRPVPEFPLDHLPHIRP